MKSKIFLSIAGFLIGIWLIPCSSILSTTNGSTLNIKPDGTLVSSLQSREGFNYAEDVMIVFDLDSNLNKRKSDTVFIYKDGIEIRAIFNCDSILI